MSEIAWLGQFSDFTYSDHQNVVIQHCVHGARCQNLLAVAFIFSSKLIIVDVMSAFGMLQ